MTFDHIYPRDWEPRAVSSDRRMKIYEQEAAEGKLQILCLICNSRKGAPQEEEPF